MTRARYATIHWLRYTDRRTPDQLPLASQPAACLSWKVGPDGALGADGRRLPSDVWCGVATYENEADARAGFNERERFVPALDQTLENWHVLLLAVAHRGECNHLDSERPGPMFEQSQHDPGGPLFVMTTAGFNLGPGFDVGRVIDFRKNVDHVRAWLGSADGRIASQVITPHTPGDDGVTMSVWRDDAAMVSAAYRPGKHRDQIERYKAEHTADRTSFTRFRALETCGTWGGIDPVAVARRRE